MGRFLKAESKPQLCQSCHLLAYGEIPSSSSFPSTKKGKKPSETFFIDANRCSSCRPHDDNGSTPVELDARREFWYAGSGSGEDEEKDEIAETHQAKLKKCKTVLSNLKNFGHNAFLHRRRGNNNNNKVNGEYVRVSQEEHEDEDEDEDEGDDDDDMPPPLPLSLRRQDAFKIDAEDLEETLDRLFQLSTRRKDVPSISVCEARVSSCDEEDDDGGMFLMNSMLGSSSSSSSSPGGLFLLPPPFREQDRDDVSPFAAAAAGGASREA